MEAKISAWEASGPFWIFRGALWERLPRVDTHSTLAHPTNMAEAWRREGAIVKVVDYPVGGIDSVAMITSVNDGGGYYRVRVKDPEAEKSSIEFDVHEDQLGRAAPPQGDINPTEPYLTLGPTFPAKPFCGLPPDSTADPGKARGKTSVGMSSAEVQRTHKNAGITAVEKAVKVKLGDNTFKQGCMRAGKEAMEACGSTNPIKRCVKYVQGYAAAVGQGVTHEDVQMWLAKEKYWEDLLKLADDADADAAEKNKTPMVFVIVSKCAADDYCAQMRTDKNGKEREHRRTLDEIREKLTEMYPANLIILIDIPATLFGCARGKRTRGYSSCRAVTAAGKVILKHMLMVLLPTAAACGFAVGGIATICADITETWLSETIHGDTVINPPPMLYGADAMFPRMRMRWRDVRERVVIGRGTHYVFMHLKDFREVAKVCVNLTAIALGINRRDEAVGIGNEDHDIMVRLAVLFHTLAGAKGRREWRAARINKELHDINPEDHPNAPPWQDALHGNLADINVGDFDDDAEGGESDPESDSESESDE